MDLVYILGTETAWNNNELKYSLRSVAMHLKEIDNIIIIGERPDFISFQDGNTFAEFYRLPNGKMLLWSAHADDMNLTKERRIMEKVKAACEFESISDNFFFMNDDMFFLSPVIANELPNYYKGTLINSAKKRPVQDRYYNALVNCHNALGNAGIKQRNNYDTHAPIIYNKQAFLNVMESYNWNAADGYVVKSLYANTLNLSGVFQPDCKIDQPMNQAQIRDKIAGREFFSIGDSGLNDDMKTILSNLYPNKSPWEI